MRRCLLTSTRQPFRLLDLPGELRSTIYKLALGDRTLHIHLTGQDYLEENPDARLRVRTCLATDSDDELISALGTAKYDEIERDSYAQRHEVCEIDGSFHGSNYSLALLHTCRQIYEEARHLPLTSNTFSFQQDWDLNRFQEILSDTRVGANDNRCDEIRSIVLGDYIEATPILQSGGGFGKLKHIRIFLTSPSYTLYDLGFELWRVLGVDNGRLWDDLEEYVDELHAAALEPTSTRYEFLSVCAHFLPGSAAQAAAHGWAHPLHTSLSELCRQIERKFLGQRQT